VAVYTVCMLMLLYLEGELGPFRTNPSIPIKLPSKTPSLIYLQWKHSIVIYERRSSWQAVKSNYLTILFVKTT